MTVDMDQWGASVPALDLSAPMLSALGTAYTQTAAAVSGLAVGLRAAEERAAERERQAGDRLDRVVAAVEALGARLDAWEAQGAATSAAHASERQARHAEVREALAELTGGLGALADQVPAALVPVLDALRRQEEETRQLRELAGSTLTEIEQSQAGTLEALRVVIVRAGEDAREQAAAQHQEQREAIAAAARSIAGDVQAGRDEVQAVRAEVLAAGVEREERQGEDLRAGLDRVRRDVDQAAGIMAGVAAAVDRTSGDVLGVREAVTAEAEATRTLVHGAAEEAARGLEKLGDVQAARDVAHHQEVSDQLAGLAGRVAAEAETIRAEARTRGENLRDQVTQVAGDVEAAAALLGEVPEQVERTTGAAADVVKRTGAAVAARVEAAEAAMTGRTDRLCEMLADSGRAADEAVISLGRRVARMEEQSGPGALVVQM
ncbi:hypothetical protein ACFT0G_06150 [Streptomyces sp. NPDC057020]|uniref:hypothetical protein n=1 Tax=unclassified Streptomyces TaxID=2593676 RepID=UPI00363068F5